MWCQSFGSHFPAGPRKWKPRLSVTSVGSTLNSTTGTPFDATSGAKRHAWTTSEDKLPQSIDHSHLVFVVLYKKLYHLGSLWTKLYRVEEIHHNCKWFTVEFFFLENVHHRLIDQGTFTRHSFTHGTYAVNPYVEISSAPRFEKSSMKLENICKTRRKMKLINILCNNFNIKVLRF